MLQYYHKLMSASQTLWSHMSKLIIWRFQLQKLVCKIKKYRNFADNPHMIWHSSCYQITHFTPFLNFFSHSCYKSILMHPIHQTTKRSLFIWLCHVQIIKKWVFDELDASVPTYYIQMMRKLDVWCFWCLDIWNVLKFVLIKHTFFIALCCQKKVYFSMKSISTLNLAMKKW